MYYSNAPEKMRKNYEQLKIEPQLQVLQKKSLLFVRFRIQEQENQKIHFTNANINNEKVLVPYYDMCKPP